MKFLSSYRLIASVLTVFIAIGAVMPSGLCFLLPDVCEDMEMMHADNEVSNVKHEDCPMEEATSPSSHSEHDKHSSLKEVGIDCVCNIDQAPLKTKAHVLQKIQLPVLNLSYYLKETVNTHEPVANTQAIHLSNSYSPPFIYLANESFLI